MGRKHLRKRFGNNIIYILFPGGLWARSVTTSNEPDRFVLTPGKGPSTAPARLPFLSESYWTGAGGGDGPGSGGGGGGGGDDGGDDDEYDEDYRRGRRDAPSHRSLTKESKSPFECKEKSDVEKYNGKENKLWRKKTTNFLAARFPDVLPWLRWAERQAEDDTGVAHEHTWVGL